MENWKDINEEEEWASKTRLVTLFFMNWELGSINVRYHAEIFEHICYQGHRSYLLWVSEQGVCH
jgi:hypothetical protein